MGVDYRDYWQVTSTIKGYMGSPPTALAPNDHLVTFYDSLHRDDWWFTYTGTVSGPFLQEVAAGQGCYFEVLAGNGRRPLRHDDSFSHDLQLRWCVRGPGGARRGGTSRPTGQVPSGP